MKSPHNSRNISRTNLPLRLWVLFEHGSKSDSGGQARNFRNYYFFLIRLATLGIILAVLVSIVSKSNYQTLPAQTKEANYLISADKLINEFKQSQNSQKLNLARYELEAALAFDPQNTFAQKQLLSVNKLAIPNIQEEIAKTQEILKARPDYSAAWLRLSILYDQLGEKELAKVAKEKALKLNSITPAF